ncbi:hypothetical protein MUP00_03310 [Candidatus Bathyarchaeota archaeon]|nr:hypothetical protein [Candidatus Bathyarchaeota archaeon]
MTTYLEYGAVYSLLLESGLRLVEAVKVINDFKGADSIGSDFYRSGLGMFHGSTARARLLSLQVSHEG